MVWVFYSYMLGLSLPYDDDPFCRSFSKLLAISIPSWVTKSQAGGRFVQINQPLFVGMPCRPPAQAHENGHQCCVLEWYGLRTCLGIGSVFNFLYTGPKSDDAQHDKRV
jgi:hypothetical protein